MNPEIEQRFLDVVREHTAGSPQREITWTHLCPREIAERLTRAGTGVSRWLVRQLLKRHRFVKRKAQKKKAMGHNADRNTQFENIARLKAEHLAAGEPVLSIDTKKKELLGNFYRAGRLYTRRTIETFDHDFPSFSNGVVIPHGLYDLGRNKAHINLGTSRDTTEFACDSIARWWETQGRRHYPHATKLLLLCDGGGSNPAKSNLFKQDLQTLANRIGLEVRVAHYPPYCSKHNPIEHRVFPHVTRACEGVVFEHLGLVKQLMQRTATSMGLRVTVTILDKLYTAGRKAAARVLETLNIVRDTLLPNWNYRILPQPEG